MKYIPSIAFEEMSGSAKGVTAAKMKSRKLSLLRRCGCEGPTFEFPGEAASDKRPPSRTSGLQARQGAAHFAHPS